MNDQEMAFVRRRFVPVYRATLKGQEQLRQEREETARLAEEAKGTSGE